MNPTLAERSRQWQRQALAQGRGPSRRVDPDLPIALRAYQQTAQIADAADAADAGLAAEPATPTPRPIGAELLLWLSLLLLDGALALLDLIGQLGQARAARAGLPARPPQAEQRSEPGPVPRSRAALAV